jgi:hypothetical protein
VTRIEDLDLFRWWDPSELAPALESTDDLDDGKIIAFGKYQKHTEAWTRTLAYEKATRNTGSRDGPQKNEFMRDNG